MCVMHVMKDLRASQRQWGPIDQVWQDATSSFGSRGRRGRSGV